MSDKLLPRVGVSFERSLPTHPYNSRMIGRKKNTQQSSDTCGTPQVVEISQVGRPASGDAASLYLHSQRSPGFGSPNDLIAAFKSAAAQDPKVLPPVTISAVLLCLLLLLICYITLLVSTVLPYICLYITTSISTTTFLYYGRTRICRTE